MVKNNILFNQFTFKKLSNYIINPYNTIKNSEKILKPSTFFYKNFYEILFILIICVYIFKIENPLQKKIFRYTFYNDKRPRESCINDDTFKCFGMPSGHTETATFLCILLYYKKYIPLYLGIFIILCTILQRILTKMHTFQQIIGGFILGSIYALIYIKLDNILYFTLFIFAISIIYVLYIIYKIDNEIKNHPTWIDKSLKPLLDKKASNPLFNKVIELFIFPTFYTWNMIEKDMDILIEKIKNTNIKFDAIVGMKSGGAILTKYIADKLNIKYYYIKASDKDYNCNKKVHNAVNDFIKNKMKYKKTYMICENIENNIENQNILLFDEFINTGSTMKAGIDYLINEKKVSYVLPITIQIKEFEKYDFEFLHVNTNFRIWPWGYNN